MSDEARQQLRDRLLQTIIENRIQLQQAEREKITAEDSEVQEQLNDIMKKVNAQSAKDFEEVLTQQGLSLDGLKKRIRDQILVQRVTRRKVALRISVTEQEIDGYINANRGKLETGLTFEARHILFLPEAGQGEDGWAAARKKAEQVYGQVTEGQGLRGARQGVLGGSLGEGRRQPGHAQARRAHAGDRASHPPPAARRVVAADTVGRRLPPVPSRREGDALGRGADTGPQPDSRHPLPRKVRRATQGVDRRDQAAGAHRHPAEGRWVNGAGASASQTRTAPGSPRVVRWASRSRRRASGYG